MTKMEQAKKTVLEELAKHEAPKKGSIIVNNVANTLIATCIEPIGKNVIQQAITALKKEGLIDYTPSTTGNGAHTISLASSAKQTDQAKPIKAGLTTPKQKDNPMTNTPQPFKEPEGVTFYEIYTAEGEFIAREAQYTAAQEKASEIVVRKMIEVEIKVVTSSVMCKYKPVVRAEYIAA